MGKLNYPGQQLAEVDTDFIGSTVNSLMELGGRGIPNSDNDLQQRVDSYFRFCEERQMRPGIESLCLALGTSRQNFWKWCAGAGGKSLEWQHICQSARQVIIAFTETAGLSGKINPASWIFILKNWAGYADSVPAEPIAEERDGLTADQLPILGMPENE